MVEMKQKNEEEMCVLKQEKEHMKKLYDKRPTPQGRGQKTLRSSHPLDDLKCTPRKMKQRRKCLVIQGTPPRGGKATPICR